MQNEQYNWRFPVSASQQRDIEAELGWKKLKWIPGLRGRYAISLEYSRVYFVDLVQASYGSPVFQLLQRSGQDLYKISLSSIRYTVTLAQFIEAVNKSVSIFEVLRGPVPKTPVPLPSNLTNLAAPTHTSAFADIAQLSTPPITLPVQPVNNFYLAMLGMKDSPGGVSFSQQSYSSEVLALQDAKKLATQSGKEIHVLRAVQAVVPTVEVHSL